MRELYVRYCIWFVGLNAGECPCHRCTLKSAVASDKHRPLPILAFTRLTSLTSSSPLPSLNVLVSGCILICNGFQRRGYTLKRGGDCSAGHWLWCKWCLRSFHLTPRYPSSLKWHVETIVLPVQLLDLRIANNLGTFRQPFRAQYPINPSWEIASRLPSVLPPKKKASEPPADGPRSGNPASTKLTPPIRIHTYPQPVHVSYEVVRNLAPHLLDEHKPDYVLHIGMASGRAYYSVERRGHRDGYYMRDVDGQLLGDDVRKIREGDDWIWAGCPDQLLTNLPFDDMFDQWTESLPVGSAFNTSFILLQSIFLQLLNQTCVIQEVDARISEDAGNYLCDFIYYTSMSHLYKQGLERKAMFFHVPVDADEAAIDNGVKIAVELIRAMVETDLKGRKGTTI
jgi:pyroglutamyl-peptidase